MSGTSETDSAKIGTATHVFMQFCDFAALAGRAGTSENPGDGDGTSGGDHFGCDPEEAVRRRIDSELKRLVDEKFIDKSSASLVNRDQIAAFVGSDLFARIISASRIWREFRFNAARNAADFTGDPELAEKFRSQRADVIVQGVVDLLFEDADGRYVLADYKTDRLSAAERRDPSLGKVTLRERHRNQLSYYREILGDMLGKRIDETLIYSLTLADTVEID